MIAKCPKPPKDNKKRRRQVRFNEKGNCTCDNGENSNDHKIYASMAQISSNEERKSEKYGDSSQLTNWNFRFRSNVPHDNRSFGFHSSIIRSRDKYIEVVDGHHVTAKKKVKYKYKCATVTERLSLQHYTT